MGESKDLRIRGIRRTCEACPSQWSARTKEGREVYIRYRWGWLTVELDGPFGELIYEGEHGDEWDGYMDTDTMLRHTGMAHG